MSAPPNHSRPVHVSFRRRFVIAVAAALTLGSIRGDATPLLPGNVIISTAPNLSGGIIREYTRSGLLVQTFTVPTSGDPSGYARDIATDASGRIHVWNGTFSPVLTTMTPGLAPGTATSVNHSLTGWSTVNATYFGGIAVSGNYVYATDMFTFSGGEPNGIVRFDLTTFEAIRFGQGTQNSRGENIDLNIGLNGLLYALYPGGSRPAIGWTSLTRNR